MLLKVGAALMLCAVALAAVAALVVAGVPGPPEKLISLRAAFSTEEEAPASQEETAEPPKAEAEGRVEGGLDQGRRLEIDEPEPPDDEAAQAEPPAEKKPRAVAEPTTTDRQPSHKKKPPKKKPSGKKRGASEPAADEPASTPPAVPEEAWPEASVEEVAGAEAPRYYPQRQDGVMSLTVEGIGLYDVPVINASTQEALDLGVIHFPQTPFPWDERDHKNVYLAGHRLGWPGTGSRLVFYNLDKLKEGDSVVLEDSLGEPYEYRVSEVFVVEPGADWAVDPVRGRDMVTLQTCTFPDLLNRLIVRADRV